MLVQIVVLVLVQRLLLTVLPVCFIIVYLIQKYYLRTSRQLRVMELEARSALYSNIYETVCFASFVTMKICVRILMTRLGRGSCDYPCVWLAGCCRAKEHAVG